MTVTSLVSARTEIATKTLRIFLGTVDLTVQFTASLLSTDCPAQRKQPRGTPNSIGEYRDTLPFSCENVFYAQTIYISSYGGE